MRHNGLCFTRVLLSLLLIFTLTSFIALADQPPASASKTVAENQITLRLHAPNAQKVSANIVILGNRPMTRDKDGVWTVTLRGMRPGIYPYTFDVDGLQIADPGSSLFQYHVVLPTALDLPGNTVYWIKIEGDSTTQFDTWGLAVASQGRDSRHINYFTGLAKFLAGPNDEAFQLRGTATPVPEPASLAVLGLGLGLTLLVRRPR
ncbi:MAG: PEP-CTERM sorting domain-containing protein [Phycisphaerae bacterium]